MTGWEHENPETFLSILKDTSNARKWCRKRIMEMAERGEAVTIMEVGCGGLNERNAMDAFFTTNPLVRYMGTDATEHFVERGQLKYGNSFWQHMDITQRDKCPILSDILYSQHVLEHLPGLNPALSNMLSMTRKVLLNIFFLPPQRGTDDTINWSQYPIHFNTYSSAHIRRVCEFNGFDATLETFDNSEFLHMRKDGDVPIPMTETVLIATRRQQ